jgi:threonine/homoserine/homoserine lactone efflux protein
MSPTVWFAFAAASIVLLVIPDPTVLLVVSYALTQADGSPWPPPSASRPATSSP